jgi:cellulose biosynthesis protein BcsQ
VSGLKENVVYDIIFIDMSCSLNKRNLALLGCADTILMILSPNDISIKKMNELNAAIGILKSKYGLQMTDHMITVINKDEDAIADISSCPGACVAPDIAECKIRRINKLAGLVTENQSFITDLNRLLEIILPKNFPTSAADAGGESIA